MENGKPFRPSGERNSYGNPSFKKPFEKDAKPGDSPAEKQRDSYNPQRESRPFNKEDNRSGDYRPRRPYEGQGGSPSQGGYQPRPYNRDESRPAGGPGQGGYSGGYREQRPFNRGTSGESGQGFEKPSFDSDEEEFPQRRRKTFTKGKDDKYKHKNTYADGGEDTSGKKKKAVPKSKGKFDFRKSLEFEDDDEDDDFSPIIKREIEPEGDDKENSGDSSNTDKKEK